MDPIAPITPRPAPVSPATPPVDRLERITRERDRPRRDRQKDRRRAPQQAYEPAELVVDEQGRPHLDIRV